MQIVMDAEGGCEMGGGGGGCKKVGRTLDAHDIMSVQIFVCV